MATAAAGAGNGGELFGPAAPDGHAKKTSEVVMWSTCFQHEAVWLMSQSPTHKQVFIADLEWLVMTPVLLGQFRLYYDQQTPIGCLFWGFVMLQACLRHDAEVESRLKAGNAKLRPQDWRSGDKLWVIDVLAPFHPAGGGQQTSLGDEMVKDLKLKLFPDRPLHLLTVDGGRLTAKVL